jgi:hypothetical protein
MVRIKITLAVVSLLAIASLPLRTGAEPRGTPLPRATGGPDSFGYSYVDSQEANGPVFNSIWEDISATGSLIFGAGYDDNVSAAISIPFQFPYYGTNYSSCYVSTNGNMHFTSPSAGYPGTTIPSAGAPNAMIAGFWADCHTGPDGHIRYAGDANRFIVQWTSCEYYPSDNAETFTYQIKILPSGIIYIAYQTMSANGGSNSTAIGIEDANGSVGLQYCYNGSPNVIASGRVIRFANNSPPAAPASLTQAASPGGAGFAAGSLTGNPVYCRANVTDPNAGNTVGLQVEALPTTSAFQTGITGPNAQTPANALVASGGVAEVTLPALADGSWHWRARGFDNNNAFSSWVEFSPAATSFSIDGTPPSAPTAPFDPSGTTLKSAAVKRSVGFSWGPAVDTGPPLPITYTVEVSFDASFATADISTTTLTTNFSTSLSASDKDYFWRVMATDGAGNQGPFAGPFSFKLTVEEGPEEPPKDILPCAAGVNIPGWTPLVGLLLAGVLLISRRLRL